MEMLFLPGDIEILDELIVRLRAQKNEVGAAIGDSCHQSAETFHDNFPFEQAMRDFAQQKGSLENFLRMRKNAIIVRPNINSDHVDVGSVVTIMDMETREVITYTIGSYHTFSRAGNVVSYAAPLGELLLDARVGDICAGKIGEKRKRFKIMNVA